jgi:type I restriction enzyme, S subunit
MKWPMVKLGDVCRVTPGFAFKSTDFTTNGIPVVKIANIRDDYTVDLSDAQCWPLQLFSDRLQKFILKDKDILVAMTGATAGKLGRVRTSQDLLLNQRVAKIEAVEAEPDFVWFALSSERYRERFFSIAGGAAQPNMSGGQIEAVEIPMPPLAAQKRIAEVLSAYDDTLETNRRRMELLDQAVQLLYQEWFLRLRFPGHEHTRITNGIPDGWERKPLTEVCESVDYGYTASAEQEEVGPKFLRITDIVPDYIDWPAVPHCPIEDDRLEKFRLREGDIVIARTGATVGYAKRLHKRHPDAVFASYLVRLRLTRDVDNLMAGVFVESADYKSYVQSRVGGAAQPNANARVLAGAEILVPPARIQRDFHDFVEPLVDQREILQFQNQKLRAARDLLLPRLVSGEIEV